MTLEERAQYDKSALICGFCGFSSETLSSVIPCSDAEAQAIAYHDGKNERYYYIINNHIRNRHDDS